MKRSATTVLSLLLAFGAALPATAQDVQDVTVREINAIPEENLEQLNAAGTTLSEDDIEELLFNELRDQQVRFTAVVLSNPRNSGLSSPNDAGLPSRVHVFVRDTSAASQGKEGMGIQIVDGSWEDNGTLNLAVGDVITVTGTVSPFFTTVQIAPESIELVGTYQNLGLPEDILDPVTITTADANQSVEGDGKVQVNWDNYASLSGQYVRIEEATVLARDISTDRPDWLVTTDGGETVLNFYDTSLRFRNDRGAYNSDEFNVRTQEDGPFVPPPPGSRINLEGFVTLAGDDPFNRGLPEGALMSINPWEDDDVEITETPPVISDLSKPDYVPGTEPVTVSFNVEADPTRTLSEVVLNYTTSSTTDTVTVTATAGAENAYTAEIPAVEDGIFVTYFAEAEDNTGARTASEPQMYRVLAAGISQIADIQTTAGSGPGDSPFVGITAAMNLTATVQSDPGTSGFIAVQDDADLGPWSGILIRPSEALLADLAQGDVIHITEAEIEEDFGVTRLANVTYTKTSSGEPLGYKTVTTDVLQDAAIAEAHEGMLLRFEDVVITSTNPDAPSGPFGEWAFSSDGTTDNEIRADDASEAVSFDDDDPASFFNAGERYTFIQGVWWFSFSNYKLIPEDLATDVGEVTNVATEGEDVPGTFVLAQNYPNPFNPVTTIPYAVPETGPVKLEVFDLLGRRVAVLVDQALTPGTYEARFDARDLASGLYVYRLRAGAQTMTRKMMLMK